MLTDMWPIATPADEARTHRTSPQDYCSHCLFLSSPEDIY